MQTGDIISICDTHIIVNTLHEDDTPCISLNWIGFKEDQNTFTQSKIITIGRDETSSIKLEDEGCSWHQASIKFIDDAWVLEDG